MLREILATNVYALLLIFSRLGGAFMLFPGFASQSVPMRFRLLLAVAMSFLLLPILSGRLPPMPTDPLGMALLVAGEGTIGIFFGVLTQVLMSALDLAGNSIGFSVGLTNMFSADPVSAQQSQLLTGMLNLIATTLVFATDSHHLMLRALVDSYGVFPVGVMPPFDEISQSLTQTMTTCLTLGFKLAAPLVVFALTFNSALALLNRLVPNMQVFFVGMPLQILIGFLILSIALPPIMMWFLTNFTDTLGPFIR